MNVFEVGVVDVYVVGGYCCYEVVNIVDLV